MSVVERTCAGWQIVALRSACAEAEVLPGKGGDILSFRRLADGLDLLWTSPWGLRARGALSAASDSEGRLMEAYPGGWQTVFPNGGDAAVAQNTTWGMHGEAWLAPFRWQRVADSAIEMTADLVHSPFRVIKQVTLEGVTVAVTETITNHGGHPVEVMWGHHPAFGAPLIDEGTIVDCAAGTVIADDLAPEGLTDVRPGASGRWPGIGGFPGGTADLRHMPGPGSRLSRMLYLSDFTRGLVRISNQRLGLGARLEWDAVALPHAWYWLEAHGTAGFPWFQRAYVLGIEPASSVPAHGITAARATMTFAPGQSRTVRVSVTITDGSPGG